MRACVQVSLGPFLWARWAGLGLMWLDWSEGVASRAAKPGRSRSDRIDPRTYSKTLTTSITAPPYCLAAKFKNHPLDQVCCAYGTGLCTEHTPEKGPGGHGGRGRKLKDQQSQQAQSPAGPSG